MFQLQCETIQSPQNLQHLEYFLQLAFLYYISRKSPMQKKQILNRTTNMVKGGYKLRDVEKGKEN